MILNNLKIIWRRMANQKMHSFIKIGGFAIGIAACLLITLFVVDEHSYDKQFQDGERILRVLTERKKGGYCLVSQPAPLARTLENEFPEVEMAGRLNLTVRHGAGSNEIRVEGETMNSHEEGFAFADQSILNIFNVPMIFGDPAHALDEPNSIVISKSKAEKYFPGENPVGKTFIINNEISKPYRIGGVMDFPEKSHINYDFLFSLKGIEFWEGEQSTWRSTSYHTYVKLKSNIVSGEFEKKLSAITRNYLIPSEREAGNDNADELEETIGFKLQPVSEVYLQSKGIYDGLKHGNIQFIWIFGIIAGFIFIIACINFINLSTAKSVNRAKEVGLRKTMGSNHKRLMGLFLLESVIYSFISVVIGTILSIFFLPFFNTLTDKSLALPVSELWWIFSMLIIVSIIIGILAGLYPSLYLSSFKPISVLKGKMSNGSKNSAIRSGLVTFQYTISIILIASTFIIYRQMGYILNKDVGFDKDQVILLHGTNSMGNKISAFKNELLKIPEIKNVSVSDYLPVSGTKRNTNAFTDVEKAGEADHTAGQIWLVDNDYIKTLGMEMVGGNDFTSEMTENSNVAIINETMATQLQLNEPIGKRITNSVNVFTVIGVVKDFHFESLRQNIRGVCLTLGNSPNIVSVKVNGTDISNSIQSIQKVWDRFSVNQPFRYTFLDENFASMYTDVKRTGRILSTFAMLAVIVACLGLFALSSFLIEQRTKEIGIRKVNGAKITDAMAFLNKDFIKWVVIAFILATPVSYYAMHKWMENFAFKANLSWWIFALSGILALGIALLTVSFQSWKAATRNPVESLRYE